MIHNDHEALLSGAVIPFAPRKVEEDNPTTSTIMALVAVTILHDAETSPEDKLIELIEKTNEAEILEIFDALEECEPGRPAAPELVLNALNDNGAE